MVDSHVRAFSIKTKPSAMLFLYLLIITWMNIMLFLLQALFHGEKIELHKGRVAPCRVVQILCIKLKLTI